MTTINIDEVQVSSLQEIEYLINAKAKGMLVHTFEESRFEDSIKRFLFENNYSVSTYSITSGLKDLSTGEVKMLPDPKAVFTELESRTGNTIFIIKDLHEIWKNTQVNRKIRDFLEKNNRTNHLGVIFVSPVIDIPLELEKLINYAEFELPKRGDLQRQISHLNSHLRSSNLPTLEGREKEAVENALIGMTLSEAVFSLKKSVVKNGKVVLNDISEEKEQIIKKTGLLEYVTKLDDMDSVGGLENLKEWLDDSYYSFSADALEYSIDPARGVVLAGFPGSGKSMTAKAIATSWNLPLLKMSMSDIMDSLVGKSEQNMSRALKLAEAVSPCVLWIDEIEKSLAGASGSSGDSGTSKRVFSSLLTWMSDKKAPVFVVATANDITTLPSELTRAGRFDDIFYLGVPGENERVDILNIHLKKRGYQLTDSISEVKPGTLLSSDISSLAKELDGFTGAEIEQVIRDATRKTFSLFKREEKENHYSTIENFMDSSKSIIPLSRKNPQLLSSLREWAKSSAICASKEEHDIVHNIESLEEDNAFQDMDTNLFD